MQHIQSVKKIANVYVIKKCGRGYNKMENMPTVKLTNGISVCRKCGYDMRDDE